MEEERSTPPPTMTSASARSSDEPPTSSTITEHSHSSDICNFKPIDGDLSTISPDALQNEPQTNPSGLKSAATGTQCQKPTWLSDCDSGTQIANGDDIGQQEQKQHEDIPDSSLAIQHTQSRKNSHRTTSLLSGIDPKNVIDYHEDEEAQFQNELPTSSTLTSSYALRDRGAKRSKLAYDIKYHPMDDRTRPSQAARRRSAHGETLTSPIDFCDTLSEGSDTEVDAEVLVLTDESEPEEHPKQIPRGKKRRKPLATTLEPSRRSLRTKSCPREAYNTKLHPQDKDLEISSDDEIIKRAAARKRKRLPNILPTIELDSEDSSSNAFKLKNHNTTCLRDSNDSDGMLLNWDHPTLIEQIHMESNQGLWTSASSIDLEDKTSSPLSTNTTAPLAGVRQKEGLDAWQLGPGKRYFRHDRDSWPNSQGQPFEIFEERLEDQLAAEAKLLSPLNFENDDKENSSNVVDLPIVSESHHRMSIIPSSQYRPSGEDNQALQSLSLVNHALYDPMRERPPSYGFEGSDGTQDERPRGVIIQQSSRHSASTLQINAHNFVKGRSRFGSSLSRSISPI